jgi:uncharacterized protein (TIGR02646 family)
MSLSPTIVNLRQIEGQVLLTPELRTFIQNMPELEGYEWEGNKLLRPPWTWGDGTKIKNLTQYISQSLDELQGEYCVYCGMRFDVTSGKKIEHIAPKGNGRYPEFMFHTLNLVHACELCNGFEKKERDDYWDTVETLDDNYEDCEFKIVHPYIDPPGNHFELNYDKVNGKVLIKGISPQGIRSIKTFKLDEEPLTTERAKQVERWAKEQNPAIEDLIYQTLVYKNQI